MKKWNEIVLEGKKKYNDKFWESDAVYKQESTVVNEASKIMSWVKDLKDVDAKEMLVNLIGDVERMQAYANDSRYKGEQFEKAIKRVLKDMGTFKG